MRTKPNQKKTIHRQTQQSTRKSRIKTQKRVLYIGNLENNSRKDILRSFRFYGPIKRLWVSKCGTYAFIEYRDPGDAHFARCRLNGGTIGEGSDKKIIVDWADIQ